MAPPRFLFVEELDPRRKSKARAHAAKERYRRQRQESLLGTASEHTVDNRLSMASRLMFSPIDLGSGSHDPFASYPFILSEDEHQLIHHYTTLIPSVFRKYWQHHVGSIIQAADLFQLYRREPVSLRAMLFETACHRASLHDLTYPIKYENLVIQEIIPNLESPTIGTILAASLLANVKRRSGEFSSMHWRAAQEMIANNGGLLSFRYEPLVFTKHTWTAIALSGTSYGFPDESADGQGYEELKTLLSKRRSMALKTLPTSQAHAERQGDYVRAKAFKTQTEFERLLKCASESIEDQERPPSVKESCRIAIILFLTSAMQECGDFSRATELYLASVTEHLKQKIDDSALSPENLLWSLLRLSFLHAVGPKCIEFWVTVVRMTAAWKRLEMADRQAIEASLWVSLELPETADSLTMFGQPKMKLVSTLWRVCERPVPKDCFCELLWFTVPI
ncbi:hypothetical protein G7Y89_g11769 [Cudoniella acicularis]|uniref:Uncharacterized protein n=1 Tax=Cudoniella acicularis TaxID=354080 RepID=A0A8H4VXQ1_9HELO|nr:hypothetical protein G7Y89_g11769 [Cudoniella acicularis]